MKDFHSLTFYTAMNSNKTVEVLQNIESNDQQIVGKSISILARFAQEKLPVSAGFVITALGFQSFLDFSEIKRYYDNAADSGRNSKNLIDAFEAAELPTLMTNEIAKAYAKISGFTDAYINLRALVLDAGGNEVSHRSFVMFDIRGDRNVIANLKQLYRNVIFDNAENVGKFFSGSMQIVVLAQKAQQAEASGVMFTTDIVTRDPDRLIIEAVYGLESIAELDSVVPDQYVYIKSTEKIVEKHVSSQEFMAVRQMMGSESGIQKVRISPAWQKRQKLDDKHILALAKTGQIIEEGMNSTQQIIWSFEAGKLWINFIEGAEKMPSQKEPNLQAMVDEEVLNINTSNGPEPEIEFGPLGSKLPEPVVQEIAPRPSFLGSESKLPVEGTDVSVHIPESVTESKNVAVDVVLNDPRESVIQQNNKVDNKLMAQKESREPLLEGKFHAGGSAEGEVSFDPTSVKPNSILVLKGDEDLSSSIKVAGFIIEDESDILAQRLFEFFKVPAITGVPLARKILKQGELIEMDGESGNIYETVPFSEQVGEIEMNFKTSPENGDSSSIHIPVTTEDRNMSIHTEIPAHNPSEAMQPPRVHIEPLVAELPGGSQPQLQEDTDDITIEYNIPERQPDHLATTQLPFEAPLDEVPAPQAQQPSSPAPEIELPPTSEPAHDEPHIEIPQLTRPAPQIHTEPSVPEHLVPEPAAPVHDEPVPHHVHHIVQENHEPEPPKPQSRFAVSEPEMPRLEDLIQQSRREEEVHSMPKVEDLISQTLQESPRPTFPRKDNLSKLLDLVDEEPDMIGVKTNELEKEEVSGVSQQDQFNMWGKSLEKIISASETVNPSVAANAIEQIVDDKSRIEQSRELTYDTEEKFIGEQAHQNLPIVKVTPYIPTATKVYVNLIDEKLPEGFENFDGIVFSSSFDQDVYLEFLEDILKRVQDKEVIAVCPPYEIDALTVFLENIYGLRNKGYRNLSLILPDYRNKKEIAEVKKVMSAVGLRRSSTFEILANLSRTINVFRLGELEKSVVDGIYVDLFRLKMNMLGVEKMTASTRYVEGMKNMVSYISSNAKFEGKTLVNITGFSSTKLVIEDVLQYGFWGLCTNLAEIDEVKREISSLEKRHISGLGGKSGTRIKINRRY